MLKRPKIRRKRGRRSVTSPAPPYDRKLDLIDRAAASARARPDAVVAVYGDECTLGRQPKLGPARAGPGPEPRARPVAEANYRYRYGGALDVARGKVLWAGAFVMGVRNLRPFPRTPRRAYPTQALFPIGDNWPTPPHPDAPDLAGEPGIEILRLPTYAPRTTPIETLWRWLIEERLRHHRPAERWEEPKQQVAAFLDKFAEGSVDPLRYVGLLPN